MPIATCRLFDQLQWREREIMNGGDTEFLKEQREQAHQVRMLYQAEQRAIEHQRRMLYHAEQSAMRLLRAEVWAKVFAVEVARLGGDGDASHQVFEVSGTLAERAAAEFDDYCRRHP